MILDIEFLPQVAAFLFVFALVYALIVYSRLFPESKGASAVIALAIAFFSILYSPFVEIMQEFMPFAALFLVVVFFIVLIKRLFFEKAEVKDAWPAVVMLAAILIVIGLIWDKIAISIPGISSENMLWIIGLVVIVLIFIAVYKHPKKD